MRVLVTGASGFIGSVVQELLSAGHSVLGLARSDESAQKVRHLGAEPIQGDIEDLESLRAATNGADGIVHTAFVHDFSHYERSAAIDYEAIQALANAKVPLVITSTLALEKTSRLGTEKDRVRSTSPRRSEAAADRALARGADVRVVRLPPSVYGEGDHAFVPFLIQLARQRGVSAYVGNGTNLWSAVHRADAVRVFRLALESGTPGARYHGVGDEAIPFRDLAAAIAATANVQVASIPASEAASHFDWIAPFVSIDFGASRQFTEESLGWRPEHPGLIGELQRGSYRNE